MGPVILLMLLLIWGTNSQKMLKKIWDFFCNMKNYITQTDKILIKIRRQYLFNNIFDFVIPVKTGIQLAKGFNGFPPAQSVH
ncbi:MAG: hypothetical protein A2173_07055 [Planctomycetes bacterium RBG_13_44_8b]|nr:MAG: hypothetical protein A2173_07055 [Planctomycetes bacterium RBG_13_44_8b]